MAPRRMIPGDAAFAAAVALLYFAFARFGLLFVSPESGVASIWPAAGFQLAVLLLSGRARRRVALAAIVASNVAANLLSGNGPAASFGFAAANALEGWLAVSLLDRFAPFPFRFDHLPSLRAFLVFTVILGNALTAVAGAAVAWAAFGKDFPAAWRAWVVADGCGMLLLAPFLVVWAAEGADRFRKPDFARLAEGAVALLLLVGVFRMHVYPEGGTERIHLSYLLLPFLVWITVRLETPGAVTANLFIAGLVGFQGLAPASGDARFAADVVREGQLFAVITGGTALVLAAVFAEKRRAKGALQRLNESLEREVAERTRLAEDKAWRLARSEAVQQRLVADLTEANAELESFSRSVSHDLRAPVRLLKGFSEALLEDCGDRLTGKGREYLGWIRQSTLGMERLIDALLSLSRVSQAEMQRGTVDLARIGAEVAEEMRRRYPGHPVDYSGPERMPAEGDPRMLRLMLETLFDNAWKFTGRRTDARVELGIAGDGSGACFVRDNGAGFDMAYADRLFAPFQRLHPEEEFPGTGIGLATVRRIVNRHGGRIWAAGAPGEGAVFHFTLRPGGACGPGEGKEAR